MNMKYELHPLCTLFPRMDGAEFDALVRDIRGNGLRDPIVLHEGMILDGGNRYRACVKAGVEPVFKQFDGENIVAFVLSANLHRRHMTPGQQAAIVASAQDWAKAQTVGRPEKGQAVDHLATVEQRAAQAGVSRITQMKADKVAKTAPELARKVGRGEISLPKAVKQVEPETPRKQKPSAPPPQAKQLRTPDGEVIDLDEVMPSQDELLAELQKENEQLHAQLKTLLADDTKAELHKMILQRDHAVRQQSEAMDRAHKSIEREKWTKRQLMRCGKAVGEDDPTKIAAAVEAIARQYRKAA